jgi:hypothetical protein
MTMWRIRIASWIPRATQTHSQYAVLIALPLQQWLHGRASMLRCIYFASLVDNKAVVGKLRKRRKVRSFVKFRQFLSD